MKKLLVMGVVALLGLATAASAAPLEPSHVGKDSKWVLHLNFDALRQTQIAKQIREKKLENPRMREKLEWIQKHFGMNPRKDLHGLTVYGDSYKRHEGVALLEARVDQEKIVNVLKKAPDFKTSEYNGTKLYTWAMHKPHEEAWEERCEEARECKKGDEKHEHHAKREHEEQEEHHAKAEHQAKEEHHEHEAYEHHEHGEHGFMVTAAFQKNLIVLAHDPEKVKESLDVLKGDKPSLAKDSPLLAKSPAGTFFYGAAVDLADLKNWNGMLDFPILQQGKNARVIVGEENGQVFEHDQFVAQSNDVAKKVGIILQGFQALLQLQAKTKPFLGNLAEGLEWNVKGDTVTLDWKADNATVLQALEHFKEKAAHMRGWHEEHERCWHEGHEGKWHKDKGEKVEKKEAKEKQKSG